ncbi:Bro-N domain-containing protein [Achromobacter denitrificans]|uniref:BRO-N domain-containing protein n=1 Tax=Achromobacter denitrificans TaxID=32002 RepID=UPI0012F8064F|nr:BRO family protein [Achromobacter denitrificans]
MRNVQHSKASRQVPATQSALDIARDEQREDEMHEARAIMASQKGGQMAVTPQPSASPFNFGDHPVRVVVRDGEPWFVAQDAMASLEYATNSKPAKVMAHIPEEWKGVNPIHTPGGEQQMLCLSEPGLYFFLGRSDKPKALPFQKWLAADVVPQIRKTGAYVPKAYVANSGDVLTKEQQDVLRQLVKSTADRLPKEKQGAASIKMWSKLKAHFGVAYRDIPQQEFSEAVSLLTRASTEWELVDEEPLAEVEPGRLLRQMLQGGRWFTTMRSDGEIAFTPIPTDSFIATARDFPGILREPSVPVDVLPDIIDVCTRRLASALRK